jgi:O-antigen/teichoic acid export membrane protein
MGLAILGKFAIIQIITVLLPAFIGCGFMTMLARDAVVQAMEVTLKHLLWQWQYLTVMYSLILGVLITIQNYINLEGFWLWAVALTAFHHFNQDGMQLLINRKRPVIASILFFLRDGGWAIIFMVVAYIDETYRTLEYMVLFWMATQAIGLLWLYVVTRDWGWLANLSLLPYRWLWERIITTRLFWLYGVTDNLSGHADKVIISSLLGFELTGVYSFYNQMALAIKNVIHSSIYQIKRPYMVEAYKAGRLTEHRAITLKLIRDCGLLYFGMGVATAFVVWYGLPTMDRPLLIEFYMVLWIVLIGGLTRMLADCAAYGLFTAHADKAFVFSSVLAMMVSLLGNIILVQLFGIWGAATTVILIAMALAAWRYYYLAQKWKGIV